jgi:hypothetical protein
VRRWRPTLLFALETGNHNHWTLAYGVRCMVCGVLHSKFLRSWIHRPMFRTPDMSFRIPDDGQSPECYVLSCEHFRIYNIFLGKFCYLNNGLEELRKTLKTLRIFGIPGEIRTEHVQLKIRKLAVYLFPP